ncbi:MAG: ArsA family ATPase [Actinomycetia bacterium]|nr:ArsA family ATPase [Actinomycetes bacterium]MCP4961586.1 ArsA family ATPase [Actinomycetes bacterium]
MSTKSIVDSQVVIIAGKGGVGKTTIAGAVALAAADTGRDVLIVEVDGSRATRRLLSVPDAGVEPMPSPSYGERLMVAAIDPTEALALYLEEHGLGRFGSRLARSGTLELIATATPGIPDLVLLGRLRQLADQHSDRLVIVDGPAAGHAIALLSTPADIIDAVDTGRIRDQAEASLAFLSDQDRVTVNLVTLPQTTPVNETIEAAFTIEERLGVRLGPMIVNMVEPELPDSGSYGSRSSSARFLAERISSEGAEIERLRAELPLPHLITSRLDVAPSGPDELAPLVAALMETPS